MGTVFNIALGRDKLQVIIFRDVRNQFKDFDSQGPATLSLYCTENYDNGGICRKAVATFFLSNYWWTWCQDPDILRSVETVVDIQDVPAEVATWCPGCEERAREIFAEIRKTTWEQLPGFFDLSSWEELKKISGLTGKDDDEIEAERVAAEAAKDVEM